MNDVSKYQSLFDGITPWVGTVPAGFVLDFLGTKISKDFLVWGYSPVFADGVELALERPTLADKQNGESWFEAVNWGLAAREARGEFVMVTLGALYGYQAVACSRMLQEVNPMPYKLVAVEPIPQNVEWIKRHMRDNGIDPNQQWIIQAVISDSNEPAFFPVGSPGLGAQNCIASNEYAARYGWYEKIVEAGAEKDALRNLILYNTTGLQMDIIAGKGAMGEVRLVSSVTLQDVLTPLHHVDLLEADLQTSEIVVFPPFRHLLKEKVNRMHLGTHGLENHQTLHQMFVEDEWEIVFSFEPETINHLEFGSFELNDGILSVRNPAMS